MVNGLGDSNMQYVLRVNVLINIASEQRESAPVIDKHSSFMRDNALLIDRYGI